MEYIRNGLVEFINRVDDTNYSRASPLLYGLGGTYSPNTATK